MTGTLDGEGIYGLILHYSLLFAMMGSSLLVLLYLWKKGRLDMDEEPKKRMMEDNPDE